MLPVVYFLPVYTHTCTEIQQWDTDYEIWPLSQCLQCGIYNKAAVNIMGKFSDFSWEKKVFMQISRPEESGSICDNKFIVVTLLHLLHQQCLRGLILQAALRKEFAEHRTRTKQIASVWLLRPQVHSY